MRNLATIAALLTVATTFLFTQESSDESLLRRIDQLHERDRHEEIIGVTEEALQSAPSGRPRAELLVRLARAELNATDLDRYAATITEEEAMEALDRVVSRTESAMREDPSLADSYFWKAAAMAQQGQIRGVLNSLFMAGEINDLALAAIDRDPEISEVWFLLGQLYRELPGRPVSFGDNVYAVSFGRLSVELHEARLEREELPSKYYDYYIQLAESLRTRNWSAPRRRSRHPSIAEAHAAADDDFTRGATWEGAIELPRESDRDEGRRILEGIIDELERLPRRTLRQERSLELAREIAGERW